MDTLIRVLDQIARQPRQPSSIQPSEGGTQSASPQAADDGCQPPSNKCERFSHGRSP
jgi:hypothetical protein